jgi:hypothetical protein
VSFLKTITTAFLAPSPRINGIHGEEEIGEPGNPQTPPEGCGPAPLVFSLALPLLQLLLEKCRSFSRLFPLVFSIHVLQLRDAATTLWRYAHSSLNVHLFTIGRIVRLP